MKVRLHDLLCCPIDRGPLELRVWDHEERPLSPEDAARASALRLDPAKVGTEVLSGVLVNTRRRIYYPIFRGVPRMLTFRTGVAEQFARAHAERLGRELPGHELPNEPGMPGEPDVLRSFSAEWVNYDWDARAYWNLTPDAWFRCMRHVLDLDRKPVRGGLVLECGIGIGGVADYVSRSEECELVGMDLGYATDAAFATFGRNRFLHIVQASAFAPPFPEGRFDFVYSFGVLHHTFSTHEAWRRIQTLPRPGGRLYVWVYSPYDEERTLVRRGLMLLERAVRPIVWRLGEPWQTAAIAPLVPAYLAYQALRAARGDGQIRYGVREAMHAARDRFTPRYIHRHTNEEVAGWFREAGYRDVETTGERARPSWLPEAFHACTGVDGVRPS